MTKMEIYINFDTLFKLSEKNYIFKINILLKMILKVIKSFGFENCD